MHRELWDGFSTVNSHKCTVSVLVIIILRHSPRYFTRKMGWIRTTNLTSSLLVCYTRDPFLPATYLSHFPELTICTGIAHLETWCEWLDFFLPTSQRSFIPLHNPIIPHSHNSRGVYTDPQQYSLDRFCIHMEPPMLPTDPHQPVSDYDSEATDSSRSWRGGYHVARRST